MKYDYSEIITDSNNVTLRPIIVAISCIILLTIAQYKIFIKSGKPGWAAFIPIYNQFVLIQISGLPISFFLASCIPGLNLVIIIIAYIKIAQKFGKSNGFIFGTLLFPYIFIPILAFDKSVYEDYETNQYAEAQMRNQYEMNQSTEKVQKTCNVCFAKMESDSKFCGFCGSKLN